ncbi:MAG: ribosomal L7Ae/L30e/S12e/Gadd45 family protein [Clostridia bacterium]|nr:ribosomal L7Ae/L30e/S12e/Gadd45 family protein [Clostridia bacterium]
MNNQFLSFLGLCRRAGKMTIGYDSVIQSVMDNESYLVILANDISKKTEKNLIEKLAGNSIEILKIPYDKEVLSQALGKLTGVLAVNDKGFAKKITELVYSNQ